VGPERTLTHRELNRALLARQMLLERARPPLPRVVERMGALQAQYAPSMYIGLWSRVEGFERTHLDRALERRSVVQGTLLRSTIHLVSRRDYWPFALAVRQARRESWVRARRGQVTEERLAAAARELRTRLADGPMRRAEVEAITGRADVVGAGLWVDLVRVPPAGTWARRRADVFGLAEDWIGPPPADLSEGDALALVVRRYLAAFGPASRAEIANWAGLRPGALTELLGALDLRRFRAADGAELLDLPRMPLPDADTPAPVRFLPTFDATMLVHARRTGIVPEEYRPRIFNSKNPQSVATFLVDGAVAGTWRHEDGRIELDPFTKLDAAVRGELREESERLAELFA